LFKQYLLEECVHINNDQLCLEEEVVLGWIPGSHPAFSFRDSMCESIKELMKIEYSTSGVSLKVTKQAASQVETMCEDIAMMWQNASFH
jgi:hypothetical protein